jgi:hypothetical protein
MATTIRVQASHASVSGIPADACVNVWHFITPTSDLEAASDEIIAAITQFYNDIESIFCANTMSGDIDYKFYDLSEPEPRVPIRTVSGSPITPTAGDGLPTECAITMSFSGSAVSGLPQRRRSGRLYLGALSTGVTTTVTGFVQVTSVARGVIQTAAVDNFASINPLLAEWAVFSPTQAGAKPWSNSAVLNATTVVEEGFIDNALDTQRRRGTLPSDRTVFGI